MVITIELESSDELTAKEGEQVQFVTPLLSKKETTEIAIPLSTFLKVPSDTIFQYLTKFVGESVKPGELIGKKKSFLSQKSYYSEHEGVIKEINHTTGSLIIEAVTEQTVTTGSFFEGEVVEKTAHSVSFKVKKSHSLKLKNATGVFGGTIYKMPSSGVSALSEDDVQETVVFAEKLEAFEQIKLETLGVRGFVTIHPLPESSNCPSAQIQNLKDWEYITETELPGCTIDKKRATIFLYAS